MSAKIERFGVNQRLSQVVKFNHLIELSGIVAQCSEREIVAQTKSVLEQLDTQLNSLGITRQNVMKVQIWLANMQDFQGMNSVYDHWFDVEFKPARACVGAQLADDHYLIEIQASAVI